jgi:purine-binding chemotaxis protein CheW
MDCSRTTEFRFASFIIDGEKPIEFAINAESMLEATSVCSEIQPLPTSMEHLEGFMHLRDDTIPIINMKKRLGLPRTDYGTGAKIAVVRWEDLRFGLLFDDIKDVLLVSESCIHPVHPALLTQESLISRMIKLDNGQRTLQLLDLNRILDTGGHSGESPAGDRDGAAPAIKSEKSYSRHVVFSSRGQDFGVPVEQVQEITFLSDIDDIFKNASIEGALRLRGHAIPVLSAARLLQGDGVEPDLGEDARILVLKTADCRYGLLVDGIREIVATAADDIMPMPRNSLECIRGIYQKPDGTNIMLIRMNDLIADQRDELQAMGRAEAGADDAGTPSDRDRYKHLITADCYLIFSITRNFAIQLNDVQEIIESRNLMHLPESTGYDRRVLNLRGAIIPVINLRRFYGYEDGSEPPEDPKLIIARSDARVIAFEVDRILTICKQVQYQKTPSLNPQLSDKQDTLDRLIEYVGETGVMEHVLVVNVGAIMDNHLGPASHIDFVEVEHESDIEEKNHGDDRTARPSDQSA